MFFLLFSSYLALLLYEIIKAEIIKEMLGKPQPLLIFLLIK